VIVVQSYNVSSNGRGLLETASVLRRHRHEVIAKFDRPYHPRWTGGLSRYVPDGTFQLQYSSGPPENFSFLASWGSSSERRKMYGKVLEGSSNYENSCTPVGGEVD